MLTLCMSVYVKENSEANGKQILMFKFPGELVNIFKFRCRIFLLKVGWDSMLHTTDLK